MKKTDCELRKQYLFEEMNIKDKIVHGKKIFFLKNVRNKLIIDNLPFSSFFDKY